MRLLELFIGFRYLRSKKSQKFISFNTLLSVGIVFIGVFILIVVISVMNGFQSQIKDKILDVDDHITITNMDGNTKLVSDYEKLHSLVNTVEGVKNSYPYIQGQGLVRFRSSISYVLIRGVGPDMELVPDLKKFITEKIESKNGRSGVYIGSELALNKDIHLGDYIEIIVPKGRLEAHRGLTPGIARFKVMGFFNTGYYEFDTKLVVMPMPLAQRLYSIGKRASGIGVKIDDVYRMKEVSSRIQGTVGFEYITSTAEERNQNLFYALKLEKLIMTIILFLVIISAGFTIMGTLVMVVMEKRKAIGILKSMGASQHSILSIFVLEGFMIGITGSTLGVIFGLAAALNLEAIILFVEGLINSFMSWIYALMDKGVFYKISLVPSNVYYIDSIPTEIKPEFVVFIAVFAVFLSTLAALFPAWHASRMKPVETIRYE